MDSSTSMPYPGFEPGTFGLHNFEIVSCFGEYLASITGMYTVIATDASKSSELTSIAGCSIHSCFGYRVNSVNSVFTAEASAIGIAIDELVPLNGACAIFTDSLSVLTALRSVNIHCPVVTLWLRGKLHRLASFNTHILLCWVPGHKGIPMDEKADSIARSVHSSAILIDSPEDVITRRDLSIPLHNNISKASIHLLMASCRL